MFPAPAVMLLSIRSETAAGSEYPVPRRDSMRWSARGETTSYTSSTWVPSASDLLSNTVSVNPHSQSGGPSIASDHDASVSGCSRMALRLTLGGIRYDLVGAAQVFRPYDFG